MLIDKPHLCTKMEVWAPRYHDKYRERGERVALLHKGKVDHATGTIIVEFTKAKHLDGQRFAIKRSDVLACELGDNGSAPMYIVPMSMFDDWRQPTEISDEVEQA